MEILSRELSEKEKQKLLPIVEYLNTHNEITKKKAVEITGKASSTVIRYLHRMEELNVLESIGKSVAAKYRRK